MGNSENTAKKTNKVLIPILIAAVVVIAVIEGCRHAHAGIAG